VELIELSTTGFRNLANDNFAFSIATNLILGKNGAGKTSLLEAIAVLGNLRSFRVPSLRAIPHHGEQTFRLRGRLRLGASSRTIEQVVEIGPPVKRSLFIDRNEVSAERYLQVLPVFAITGPDRQLIHGRPKERRALLDRFIFLIQPTHLEALRSYRRAIRQRNSALSGFASDSEMVAWEGSLAAAAAKVIGGRIYGAEILRKRFSEVYDQLRGEDFPEVEIRYRAEGWCDPKKPTKKVEELYQQRYNETRARDRQNGFTGDGPHRHDLSLLTSGRGVRNVLSTGQSKVTAAALRLATLSQVEKERGERFPVIVDDVDAELDEAAIARLVNHLGEKRQLFLSSTDGRAVSPGGIQTDRFWLQRGSRVQQEAESDE
jgi:DNA replication and repair protein RecF